MKKIATIAAALAVLAFAQAASAWTTSTCTHYGNTTTCTRS
jgi:hypothetical protein